MHRFCQILSAILVFCAGILCGRLSYRVFPPKDDGGDTLVIHDTIRIKEPVPKAIIPDGYELIPVGKYSDAVSQIVALQDSLERKPKIITKDSLVFIEIPMEKKEYREDNFYAVVSGYNPSLDYIETYNTTKIVRSRWGIGVSAGVAVTKNGLSPAISAGITYNLLPF